MNSDSMDLVIVGVGGFGREVHQVVEDLQRVGVRINFLGFLDSDPAIWGSEVHGFPVLGGIDWLAENPSTRYSVGVGSPVARRSVVDQIRLVSNSQPATLIHPRAWIGNRVTVGAGSVVCAGNSITTDIHISQFVVLNLNSTVGHDTVIKDFVTVAPTVNISGGVTVGEGSDLGTGSTVLQDIEIGDWSVVGGGAVVVKNVPANSTAVGVPAKVIKTREPRWWQAHSPQSI